MDPVEPEAAQDAASSNPSRQYSAETYWRRLAPHLKSFGITRVSDITGLDHISLPVTQVCRPDARSNAVTQGKGINLANAAVGGVLECIEMAAGENLTRLRPHEDDEDQGELWAKLAPGVTGWPNGSTHYVAGWNIGRQKLSGVPRDVLSTDFSIGADAEKAPILRTSVGLGAGSGLAEAIWHGLLECIENDARLRCLYEPPSQIEQSVLQNDMLKGLVSGLTQRGLRSGFSDMTAHTGPFCVMARIMEDPRHAASLPLPADGFACRPTYEDAALAALLEAIQARLAVISGAREDMTWELYNIKPDQQELTAEWERLKMRGEDRPQAQPCPEDAFELAKHLEAQGLGPIIAVPLLACLDIPLYVCRIVAPNLLTDPERVPA